MPLVRRENTCLHRRRVILIQVQTLQLGRLVVNHLTIGSDIEVSTDIITSSILLIWTKWDKRSGQVNICDCSVLSYGCINLYSESDSSTILQLHTIERIGNLGTTLTIDVQYITCEGLIIGHLTWLIVTYHVWILRFLFWILKVISCHCCLRWVNLSASRIVLSAPVITTSSET